MGRASRQISLPFIRIDRKSRRPLYEQLYDGIRRAILEGRLRPDDRLPATRLIAEELGVSRNIVVMAFEQLMMEGYIRGRRGSGSFVSGEMRDKPTKPVVELLGEGRRKSDEERRLGGHFVQTLERVVLPRNTMREEILPFQTGQPAFDAFPFAVW